MTDEFTCEQCGNICDMKDKGKATRDGKEIDVCKHCCYEEQKRQFYEEM